MKLRSLGKTGVEVSEVGFGAWAIGGSSYGPTQDDASLEALEAAWEHGVTFYDTADTYGHGHSETLLARFLKGRPRDQVILASKAGWNFYEPPSRKCFTPAHLRFACEQSLKRLDTGYLDVYQLHNPSLEEIQRGEAVEELDRLRREGKIRVIGISVHRQEEALAALQDDRVQTLQLIFNLLDQRMAGRVFQEARSRGVGLIAREPLASGLLTGKYHGDHVFEKDDHRRRWTKEKLGLDCRKTELIRGVLAAERLSLVQAALEFVLDFEEISTVIPGVKTRAQLLENVLASEQPCLRIQESSQLRELYKSNELFSQGLIPR